MPKVSVIIPTYNRAGFLPEAVESVLNQTYRDFEIIIVDDGSTDRTKDILRGYVKDTPSVIRYFYQENRGEYHARNTGLRNAAGEYISFLDSDDIMLPRNLEIKVKTAEEEGLKFITSDYYEISNPAGNITQNTETALQKLGFLSILEKLSSDYVKNGNVYIIPKIDFLRMSLKRLYLTTNTVFIEKNFLFTYVRGLFDTKLEVAGDEDMWYRILLNPRLMEVGYIEKPLSVYRSYNSSWRMHPRLEECNFLKVSRLINNAFKYRKDIGNRYFAESLWETLWIFKRNKAFRFYFYNLIFKTYPWRIKYWRSFLKYILIQVISNSKRLICRKSV